MTDAIHPIPCPQCGANAWERHESPRSEDGSSLDVDRCTRCGYESHYPHYRPSLVYSWDTVHGFGVSLAGGKP